MEEVWNGLVDRTRRRSKVVTADDVLCGRLFEPKVVATNVEMDPAAVLGKNIGIVAREPICKRRRGFSGPRIFFKKSQEVEETFLSPVGSSTLKRPPAGYGRVFVDVDLPVVCPPTV